MDKEDAKEAFKRERDKIKQLGLKIIDDCYGHEPATVMTALIEVVVSFAGAHKLTEDHLHTSIKLAADGVLKKPN